MSNFIKKMKQILIMTVVVTASIATASPAITIAATEDKISPVVTERTTVRCNKNRGRINF